MQRLAIKKSSRHNDLLVIYSAKANSLKDNGKASDDNLPLDFVHFHFFINSLESSWHVAKRKLFSVG